jgi:structural maintenance of chromosome 1
VFKAFCKKIKVANIREYEDVQLRVASEENEKMAEFVTSQNRIGHQYVHNEVDKGVTADM